LIAIEPLAPDHFEEVARWLSNGEINQWLASEWRGRSIDPVVISVAVRNKRNRLFLVRCDGNPCGLVALADWDAGKRLSIPSKRYKVITSVSRHLPTGVLHDFSCAVAGPPVRPGREAECHPIAADLAAG